MTFKTDQENFWAGKFGEDYISRNQDAALLSSNVNFFAHALRQTEKLGSCIEFGSNIGMNLKALQLLYSEQEQSAIEINAKAAEQLRNLIPSDNVHNTSILEYEAKKVFDLVLIKGVMIHINPDLLPQVYEKLVRSCGRYLLVAEYYNPKPVAIEYRGHQDRLFKRDFAGELMDAHPQMKLIDYGFAYHRDTSFPQDDVTWFLMEKRD